MSVDNFADLTGFLPERYIIDCDGIIGNYKMDITAKHEHETKPKACPFCCNEAPRVSVCSSCSGDEVVFSIQCRACGAMGPFINVKLAELKDSDRIKEAEVLAMYFWNRPHKLMGISPEITVEFEGAK